jgi:hypothetical protein
MSFIVSRAYCELLHFDVYLARGNFAALCQKVRNCPIRESEVSRTVVETIGAAVDMACIWYWKEVRCLQRSAVTVCLLKHHGVNAQMMIGAQQMPFKAHAWVEVDGRVVGDKPYMREIYAVLDRC